MDCIINWTRLQRILNGNCKCTNLFSSWRWWNKSKIYGLTVGCKTAINTRCNNFMFIIDFWCMNAALKLKKNIWMLAYFLMNRWSQKSFTLSKKFDTHTQIPVVNIFANQRIKLHTKIYMKVVQISNIKVHIYNNLSNDEKTITTLLTRYFRWQLRVLSNSMLHKWKRIKIFMFHFDVCCV